MFSSTEKYVALATTCTLLFSMESYIVIRKTFPQFLVLNDKSSECLNRGESLLAYEYLCYSKQTLVYGTCG